MKAKMNEALNRIQTAFLDTLQQVRLSYCVIALLGSGILAFGLYNVHALSGVTEGGILGMTLLLEHWFALSPSVSSFIMNALCYWLGWKILGHLFIFYSVVASAGFSLFYAVCEQFDPLWPWLANTPLFAALLGAVFVGVGAGLCVRVGGAPGGDDAIAMTVAHVAHIRVEKVYLATDLVVLALALTYIPWQRMGYSLLTVILSGQLVGLIQRLPLPGEKQPG